MNDRFAIRSRASSRDGRKFNLAALFESAPQIDGIRVIALKRDARADANLDARGGARRESADATLIAA